MADYLRLADDKAWAPSKSVAGRSAAGCWAAIRPTRTWRVTLSLAKVRDVVRRYLSEPVKLERGQAASTRCRAWKARRRAWSRN